MSSDGSHPDDGVPSATGTVTHAQLFDILRGYSSTLEVQLMISEAVARAQKTSTQPSTALLHEDGDHHHYQPYVTESRRAASQPSDGWAETLLKAQIEESLTRQLPGWIRAEVARQLNELAVGAGPSHETSGGSTGSPLSNAVSPIKQSSPARPPLPRSPSTRPLAERESGSSEDNAVAGDVEHERAILSTQNEVAENGSVGSIHRLSGCHGVAETDEEAEAEELMGAVDDLRHLVDNLQRQVNELAHQQRCASQRVGRLLQALELPLFSSVPAKEAVSSPSRGNQRGVSVTSANSVHDGGEADTATTRYGRLYADLLIALDACQGDVVRSLLCHSVDALLAPQHATRSLQHPRPPSPSPSLLTPTRSPGEDKSRYVPSAASSVAQPATGPPFGCATPPPPPPSAAAVAAAAAAAVPSAGREEVDDDGERSMSNRSPGRVPALQRPGGTRRGGEDSDPSRTPSPVSPVPLRVPATLVSGAPSMMVVAGAAKEVPHIAFLPPPQASVRQGFHPESRESGSRRQTLAHSPPSSSLTPSSHGKGCLLVNSERVRGSPPPSRSVAVVSAEKREDFRKGGEALAATSAADHGIRDTAPRTYRGPAGVRGASLAKAALPSGNVLLGIEAITVPPGVLPQRMGQRGGVRVLSVEPGELGERVGLRAGDVVVAVCANGTPLSPVETCGELVDSLRVALHYENVSIEVYRHNSQGVLRLSLEN